MEAWSKRSHVPSVPLALLVMFFAVMFMGGPLMVRAQPGDAIERKAVTINPDQGKMGIYRALAQLAYRAYTEKDDQTAAVLARILERCWDKGEGDLRKSSPDTWSAIDRTMDGFIKPLTGFPANARSGEAKEQAAFHAYLEALSLAD